MIDMLGRELKVDDFVVSYNNIYQIKSIGRTNKTGTGSVKIMLVDPSKTTRPVLKYSGDLCKLAAGEVMIWMLKKDYK